MKQFLTFFALGASLSLQAQWTPINSGTTTATLDAIHFFNSQNGICSGGFINQRKTTDGGLTWTPGTQGGVRDYSFFNPTNGFAASIVGQSIKKTTDGAQSWAQLTPPNSNSLWAVATLNSTTALVAGTGGVLWRTTNGTSFTVLSSGTTSLITDLAFTDPTTVYMAVQSGIIRKTTNAGTTWTTVYTAQSGFTEMSFPTENVGYVAGSGGKIHKTTDAGVTWAILNTGIPNAAYQGIHFFDINHGVAVGLSGVIITTEDGGATWCRQQSGTTQHLRDVKMLSTIAALVIGDSGTILRNPAISNLDCILSTPEDQLEAAITLYPNPIITDLTITADNIKDVRVFGITGQFMVVPKEYLFGTIKLDFSELPAGTYLLEIFTETGTMQRKVTK